MDLKLYECVTIHTSRQKGGAESFKDKNPSTLATNRTLAVKPIDPNRHLKKLVNVSHKRITRRK
jgi:hypothetical protein